MIVKTSYRSHFRIKKGIFKNLNNKHILTKNIVIFILFSKFFFKKCVVGVHFAKSKKTQTSLLKAPSRHKQFFHQVCFEYFYIKFVFLFPTTNIATSVCCDMFKKMDNVFIKIGSNTMTRTKYLVVFDAKQSCFILKNLYKKYQFYLNVFRTQKNFIKIKQKPFMYFIYIYSILIFFKKIFFKNNSPSRGFFWKNNTVLF